MGVSQADLRRQAIIRHVIYLLVAVAIIVPYLDRTPLRFRPSPYAVKLYDKLNGLKPRSHVLLSFDYDPTSKGELYPMSMALLRHCFQKDLIPVVMTHWQGGLGLFKEIIEKTAGESEALWGRKVVSGRDYVFLGYRPGWSNLLLNMGENFKGAFAKDFYGRPTEPMPALEGVRTLTDIDAAVDVAAGATVEMWIAYGSDRFGFPLGVGTTAVMAPDLYPFLQSNQLVGFLGGLRGAADYEQLIQQRDVASIDMRPQTVTHILLIVLILMHSGNKLAVHIYRSSVPASLLRLYGRDGAHLVLSYKC